MARIKSFFLLFIISILTLPSAVYAEESVSSPPAKRVVALTWSSAEALLALGITPIGIADRQGYNDWVKEPQLPTNVVNVGTRAEPNLEKIHALQPDLIVSSSRRNVDLSSIADAQVLTLDTFNAQHDNGQAIDRHFLEIAKAVGKTETAKLVLKQRDAQINTWKQKLEQHFADGIPKVTLVHFLNTTTAAVYGQNSSVEYALSKLGISPAIPTQNTAYGVTHVPLEQLSSVGSQVLIYIRPFVEEQKLFSSVLWKHMPFVKQKHFLTIEPCWTFGSASSIERIAKVTTNALLAMDNQ